MGITVTGNKVLELRIIHVRDFIHSYVRELPSLKAFLEILNAIRVVIKFQPASPVEVPSHITL